MARLGTLLVTIVASLLFTVAGTSLAAQPTTVPDEATPGAPPITVTDFYPESSNLSDCIGLVEKSGCGSGSRGGAGQNLVFVALALGVGFVFWRISVGIRANRRATDSVADDDR